MASVFRDSAAYQETVSSGAEVKPFLLKHIPTLTGLQSVEVEADGGYVSVTMSDEACFDGILSLHSGTLLEAEEDSYVINDVNVGGGAGYNFRGKGVGALGMKAHLARAADVNSGVVYIHNIIGDGFGFWPAMGAIPLQEEMKMANLIDEGVSWYSVPSADMRVLEAIATTARKYPYLAFRLLAQTLSAGRSESYKTIRDGVIENLGVAKDWALFPAEPSTNALLKDKLGALPAFPPVDKNHHLYEASRQLAHAPQALRALNGG